MLQGRCLQAFVANSLDEGSKDPVRVGVAKRLIAEENRPEPAAYAGGDPLGFRVPRDELLALDLPAEIGAEVVKRDRCGE